MSLQKTIVTLPSKKIIGLEVRTSYQNEINPLTAKIMPLVGKYMQKNIGSRVPNKTSLGTVIDGFTGYDTSFQNGVSYEGPYTYFIGDEVSSFDDCPSDLSQFEIPGGTYVKFTTPQGPIPFIIIQAWQSIWKMSEQELGGKRTFGVDFEVFDARAENQMAAVIDIYVGIEPL